MRGDLDGSENVRSWRANAKEQLCEHTEAPTARGEEVNKVEELCAPPYSSPPFSYFLLCPTSSVSLYLSSSFCVIVLLNVFLVALNFL
jgi:hypothetical protein